MAFRRAGRTVSVAIVGCGLIGKKRARWIAPDPRTRIRIVADVSERAARDLAGQTGAAWTKDWKKAVSDPSIDAVIVSTPNHLLLPVSREALRHRKSVLVEKPMARNLKEAGELFALAGKSRSRLKVGYNHRYHPAIEKAYAYFKAGRIGRAINLRAQYGHGGRTGYQKEWRGKFKLAGGGELTDQGVHVIDLIQWFLGLPSELFAYLQTAVWPIRPSEDNGFVLMRYKGGPLASFHCSWTQWKNLFNFEIFGEKGSISVNGLGGSYGTETLTLALRRPEGGVPRIVQEKFTGEDDSWRKEWNDFLGGVLEGRRFQGTVKEGLEVMRTLAAVYRSQKTGRPVRL